MSVVNENDFFAINIKILTYAGLWYPPENLSRIKKIRYWLYNYFCIAYCVLIFAPSELGTIATTFGDINAFMKNVNMAMTHLLAAIKVAIWFIHHKDIMGIVDTLRKNVIGFEPIDDFNPEIIEKKEKRLKDLLTKIFFTVGCFVSCSACLNSTALLILNSDDDEIDFGNSTGILQELKLPYTSWIPWDYRSSKFSFFCAIWYQFWPVLGFAFMIVGFDTFYVSIISYVSCQLTILQGTFRTVRSRVYRRLNLPLKDVLREPKWVDNELFIELNKSIKALQTIFIMCQKMESIYTYLTLIQVMISLIVLCTCLFLTSSIPLSSGKFLAELIYLVAIEIQLSLYCYFGNKVTTKSEDIPQSIVDGDWFACSESYKRNMLITMTRMMMPIYFTIGKFTPLTLSTLVTIGRGSYSFFAVLKNS